MAGRSGAFTKRRDPVGVAVAPHDPAHGVAWATGFDEVCPTSASDHGDLVKGHGSDSTVRVSLPPDMGSRATVFKGPHENVIDAGPGGGDRGVSHGRFVE